MYVYKPNVNTYYIYNNQDTNYFYFGIINTGDQSVLIKLRKSDSYWLSPSSYSLELRSNKVSAIAGNETSTTKYPNTKAVADYVDGICGNILTILQSI